MLARMRSAYWRARLALQKLSYRAKRRVLRTVRKLLGLPARTGGLNSMWEVTQTDARGRLIWADFGHNVFHDEGEEWACQVLFSETASVPAAFYLGLDHRTSLAESDTLEDLSGEPSTNGYARKAVNSDAAGFTVSQESGDYQAKTKQVTFTASGGSIGPVTKMFLCTVATGTTGPLIASRVLSQERTLADGESLNCTMFVRFGE